MTHPSRAKGSKWERELVAWLRANGWPEADRAYGEGRSDDRGDIDGVPGVCIQAKNVTRADLAGGLDAAVEQAHGRLAVLALRRRGTTNAGEAFAVLRLADLFALLGSFTVIGADD